MRAARGRAGPVRRPAARPPASTARLAPGPVVLLAGLVLALGGCGEADRGHPAPETRGQIAQATAARSSQRSHGTAAPIARAVAPGPAGPDPTQAPAPPRPSGQARADSEAQPPGTMRLLANDQCRGIAATAASAGTAATQGRTRAGASPRPRQGRARSYVLIGEQVSIVSRLRLPQPLQVRVHVLLAALQRLRRLYLAGLDETAGRMNGAIALAERRAARAARSAGLPDCTPRFSKLEDQPAAPSAAGGDTNPSSR